MKNQNKNIYLPNHPFNRFYPHYGAGSRDRNTNLYKNGKTKGKNKTESRTMGQSKLSSILKISKKEVTSLN